MKDSKLIVAAVLLFVVVGCSQQQQHDIDFIVTQSMGEGYPEPVPGYLYMGDRNSFIVYYPDCPFVATIPPENLRYYTETPLWHRLDEECRLTVPGPCDNVNCGDGFVCSNGLCVPDPVGAESFMTGSIGWNNGIAVQPSLTIHPKDLDSDLDVDTTDFAIAQSYGTWDVATLEWEQWPYMTFYIKSNFRYNGTTWVQIDDELNNSSAIVLRAHSMQLPFGWVWKGKQLCGTKYIYRNSLLYGKTFTGEVDATLHYYASKAQNWSDVGDLSPLPRPVVGNGIQTTVKQLFRYTVYPDWLVKFTGNDYDGTTHTDVTVTGVSLSSDGWELIVDDAAGNDLYVRVAHNMQVDITEMMP